MVDILHYETASKGKTIGYADIRIPILKPTVIILRRVSHVQSGDRKWFNLPAFPRDALGAPTYYKYAEFEEAAYNKSLLDSLSGKVKEYCDKLGIGQYEHIEPSTSAQQKTWSNDELPF